MKRESFALLLQPFKNKVLPVKEVKTAMDFFIDSIVSITTGFPQIRLNLLFPAYLLEVADPLKIALLRSLSSKNIIEIICEGYTEPFLSISPRQLTIMNIEYGIKVIEENIGKKPAGFSPPFSNWEPSFIEDLSKMGFRYVGVSDDIFPEHTKDIIGYWTTEYKGFTLPLIGTKVLNILKDNINIISLLKDNYQKNKNKNSNPFIVFHLLIPLDKDKINETILPLTAISQEIDKFILNFQPMIISEYINNSSPEGLLYLQESLRVKEIKEEKILHFLNKLFTYDQVGIIQRRLYDIYQRITSEDIEERERQSLYKSMFFIQDINRYLPANEYGFQLGFDRESVYRRLIALNIKLHSKKQTKEGSVRITDFLKDGRKVIILTNKNIEAIIDPYIGGQIISFDFNRSFINLCSVYNPSVKSISDIVVPEISRNWFIDRILPSNISEWDYLMQYNSSLSDFHKRYFSYRIRKIHRGINVNFNYLGAFTEGEKTLPIHIEKVLGLESDSSEIVFVYQLINPSLINYNFTFAIEFFIYLPGISKGMVSLHTKNNVYEKIGLQFLRLPSLTEWNVEDRNKGIKLHFHTQKEVALWCLSSTENLQFIDGIRLIMTFPVKLEPSFHYKITGKIHFSSHKRVKDNGGEKDVL